MSEGTRPSARNFHSRRADKGLFSALHARQAAKAAVKEQMVPGCVYRKVKLTCPRPYSTPRRGEDRLSDRHKRARREIYAALQPVSFGQLRVPVATRLNARKILSLPAPPFCEFRFGVARPTIGGGGENPSWSVRLGIISSRVDLDCAVPVRWRICLQPTDTL